MKNQVNLYIRRKNKIRFKGQAVKHMPLLNFTNKLKSSIINTIMHKRTQRLIIYTLFSIFSSPLLCAANSISFTSENPIKENMADLERIYKYAQDNFLYEIDHKKVYEAMAEAMLSALDDQWTCYINSDESKNFKEMITGKYGGIGIMLTKTATAVQDINNDETLYVQVISVFNDSPAEKAGLETGDLITEIDGESVIKKSSTECSNMLRGDKGTKLKVKVKRLESEFELEIIRDIIDTPSVETEELKGNVLYIRINSFTSNTAEQMKNALSKSDNAKRKIILDLRNNGGGDVSTCLEIADMFLKGGKTLIKTVSKVERRNKTYTSSSISDVPQSAKIIILINSGTASASEILALALKKNDRATLVGEKSYGKGVMQVSSPFKDGIINITTAEYVAEDGTKVNKIGLEPDVEVENETIEDKEEIERFIEFRKSGDVSAFIKENPEFTKENVRRGTEKFSNEYDVSEWAVEYLLVSQYRLHIPNDERKLVYPEYDKTLQKAIELLK